MSMPSFVMKALNPLDQLVWGVRVARWGSCVMGGGGRAIRAPSDSGLSSDSGFLARRRTKRRESGAHETQKDAATGRPHMLGVHQVRLDRDSKRLLTPRSMALAGRGLSLWSPSLECVHLIWMSPQLDTHCCSSQVCLK